MPLIMLGVQAHAASAACACRVGASGLNASSQLGATTIGAIPAAVGGLTGVKAITAGSFYSLALLVDGTVKAWGRNGDGELGDGSTTDRATPVAVGGLTGVQTIVAGDGRNLVVLADGTVKTWGDNEFGQLGITDRTTPVTVQTGPTRMKAVAAGVRHSLAA